MKYLTIILTLFAVVVLAQPGLDANKQVIKGGEVNTTTNGSGQIVLSHGVGESPETWVVSMVSNNYWIEADADSENITITFTDPLTDLPLASTSVNFTWIAIW